MKIKININKENIKDRNTLNIIYSKVSPFYIKNNNTNITFNIAGEKDFSAGCLPKEYLIQQINNNIDLIKEIIIKDFNIYNKNKLNYIKEEKDFIILNINNNFENFFNLNINIIKDLIIKFFLKGTGIIKNYL